MLFIAVNKGRVSTQIQAMAAQLIPTFFSLKSYFFELGEGRAPSSIYVWKTIPTVNGREAVVQSRT